MILLWSRMIKIRDNSQLRMTKAEWYNFILEIRDAVGNELRNLTVTSVDVEAIFLQGKVTWFGDNFCDVSDVTSGTTSGSRQLLVWLDYCNNFLGQTAGSDLMQIWVPMTCTICVSSGIWFAMTCTIFVLIRVTSVQFSVGVRKLTNWFRFGMDNFIWTD